MKQTFIFSNRPCKDKGDKNKMNKKYSLNKWGRKKTRRVTTTTTK